MKKLFGLGLIGASAMTLASCGFEGTTIEIAVDSTALGGALVDEFNATYTGNEGKDEKDQIRLSYVNVGSADLAKTMATDKASAPDIALVIGGEVIGRETNFVDVSANVEDYIQYLHEDATNKNIQGETGIRYVPAYYDGMAFAYNATLMEKILGADYAIDEISKLPLAFDTWEEIMAFSLAAQEASKDSNYYSMPSGYANATITAGTDLGIKEVFPVGVNEPWSGYALLTTGGFEAFYTDEGEFRNDDFGYDQASFLTGLELLDQLSDNKVSFDKSAPKAGSSMGWRWGDIFTGDFLFSQIGTWEDVDSLEEKNNIDVKFTFMPTYNGVAGSPFIKTKGWVINAHSTTAEKNASLEVLDWLMTKKTQEVVIANSTYIDTFEDGAAFKPTSYGENALEITYAIQNNVVEATHKLSNNAEVAAMDIYYNEAAKLIMCDLWDGVKTPAQAQTALISLQTTFLADKNKA